MQQPSSSVGKHDHYPTAPIALKKRATLPLEEDENKKVPEEADEKTAQEAHKAEVAAAAEEKRLEKEEEERQMKEEEARLAKKNEEERIAQRLAELEAEEVKAEAEKEAEEARAKEDKERHEKLANATVTAVDKEGGGSNSVFSFGGAGDQGSSRGFGSGWLGWSANKSSTSSLKSTFGFSGGNGVQPSTSLFDDWPPKLSESKTPWSVASPKTPAAEIAKTPVTEFAASPTVSEKEKKKKKKKKAAAAAAAEEEERKRREADEWERVRR
jgi:chemotaxis protein histidine kinase CheA